MSLEPSPHSGRRDPVPSDSRYECLLKIASGGMATVYVGRLRGAKGFWRLVAIKRAHAHLVGDEVFRKALIAEARLASHIHHQNVVSVVDVEEPAEELLLIMDYVEGASLSQLITAAGKAQKHLPPEVVVRIVLDAAAGLHAAHELNDENGTALEIVHRDVSPQNILVGIDGASRIADFGIAKCADSGQATQTGLKGKVGYMAPEYIKKRQVDRRVDVFGLGVVAWEALTGERLFKSFDELAAINAVLESTPRTISDVVPSVPPELDACIQRALAKDPSERYPDALTFARELEAAAKSAGLDPSGVAVTNAVRDLFGEVLDERRETLRGLLQKGGAPLSIRPAATPAAGLDVTRTRTVDVRGSISDARTVQFVRGVDDPPSTPEHTQDLTALADAREAPPSVAAPARWKGVAAVIGGAAFAIVAWSTFRATRAPEAAATSLARPSDPAPAAASANPSRRDDTAPSPHEPSAAPSASTIDSSSATPSASAALPIGARRPPPSVPKTDLGKRPGRPGLGY